LAGEKYGAIMAVARRRQGLAMGGDQGRKAIGRAAAFATIRIVERNDAAQRGQSCRPGPHPIRGGGRTRAGRPDDERTSAHAISSASFRTVFQLRPVPATPSFLSMSAIVSRERPTPSG